MLLEANSGRLGGVRAQRRLLRGEPDHGEENGRSRWPEEYDDLTRLGRANLADALEADVRELGIDAQLERTGMLSVAVEEHQVDRLRGRRGSWSRTAVRAEIASPVLLAGDWEREDCPGPPARLGADWRRRQSRGSASSIHEHTRVVDPTSRPASRGGRRA